MRAVDTRVLLDAAEVTRKVDIQVLLDVAEVAQRVDTSVLLDAAAVADQCRLGQVQQLARLADQFELEQAQRMAKLVAQCNARIAQLADDRYREMATLLQQQLDQAMASSVQAAELLVREIDLGFRDLVVRTAEAVWQHLEAQRRTLEELERCADALEGDPREEYRHAGAFLRKALDGYREASEVGDSYKFADVIHWAVGALEEVLCQLPGVKAKTLGQALKQLEAADVISNEDRGWLEEIYRLRNEKRGIGHGAGGAPEYVAIYVLFSVRAGLDMFLPLRQLSDQR